MCKQALIGANDLDKLLTDNEIFIARTRGIGKLSIEDAIDFGATGPVLRASGLKFDLRRDEPYSIYDRFDFDIPTGTNGDSYDRYLVRLAEIRQSVRIVEQALEQMPDGPILPERMPRALRPAAGEVYMRCENPRGEYGVYLISEGRTQPYRLRIRSSCVLQPLGAEAHDDRPLRRRRRDDPRLDRHRPLRGGPVKGSLNHIQYNVRTEQTPGSTRTCSATSRWRHRRRWDAGRGRRPLSFWLMPTPERTAPPFNRDATGLNHLGIHVESADAVNRFFNEYMKPHGIEPAFETPRARPTSVPPTTR